MQEEYNNYDEAFFLHKNIIKQYKNIITLLGFLLSHWVTSMSAWAIQENTTVGQLPVKPWSCPTLTWCNLVSTKAMGSGHWISNNSISLLLTNKDLINVLLEPMTSEVWFNWVLRQQRISSPLMNQTHKDKTQLNKILLYSTVIIVFIYIFIYSVTLRRHIGHVFISSDLIVLDR